MELHAVPRKHYLDWLRVLAILTIFIYHSGRFFSADDWNIKNPTTYPAIDAVAGFPETWLMPLLFVISGASLFFALGKTAHGDRPAQGGLKRRSGGLGGFLKDKALRLLAPLVVGIFTHIALQVYLERLTHGEFSGSFLAFYPHYFEGLYGISGNFAWQGLHLWYLEALFAFCLLCLPLFAWLKSSSGGRVLNRLGDYLARPGAAYLLALPVILLINLLSQDNPFGTDCGGWSLPAYLIFFLSGFVVTSNEPLQQAIQRQRRLSLAVAVVGEIVSTGMVAFLGDPAFGTAGFVLIHILRGLRAWCWILAFLGFGMQRLNFSTAFLRYANEAVLPFYILHQTILVCVGYFVVQWAIPDLAKYAIIAASSFAVILGLYEFLVRRFNFLRVLFGMRPLGGRREDVYNPHIHSVDPTGQRRSL
ncbi:MAG: acyltransferase [Chloroflexi bacterium]|nr:acyltransferase [Chloroflexota bacterium]